MAENNAVLERFGKSVRERRLLLGLTQEDLADASGLHRTYIAGIEAGRRNITLRVLARLATSLQVPPAELLK
ncbi:MAG: helix-turn-helix domain-containing protein [Alphaproteobacteria bacterium]